MMKKVFPKICALPHVVLLILILVSVNCFAQLDTAGTHTNEIGKDSLACTKIFSIVEEMPSFPGGDSAMVKFIMSNFNYPAEAKKNKISGKLFVTFVVGIDGSIQDVRILRGVGGGCNEEAVRVVKAMPNWIPGKQAGKNVCVQFNLPLNIQ